MQLYALRHQDGNVSILELHADHGLAKELEDHPPAVPVVEAIEITVEQAAAIRAARSKPEVQADSAPVSGVDPAELRALKAELADMAAELADFRQFKAGLAQAIAEKKAQEI